MKLKKYFTIWLKTTQLSLQSFLINRQASLIYLTGKLLRFTVFILILKIVASKTENLAGFNFSQLLNFFLVFNLLDILGQLFFRGIYWFRHYVVTGAFDFNLVKPFNPLFQILTSRTDFLDLLLLVAVVFLLVRENLNISLINLLMFLLIIVFSFLFVTAVHILVAAVGVATTEVDHVIWIYRDISHMARVPVDIYLDSIRAFLTFVIPVALVFTYPAKALMNLLSWQSVFFTMGVSLVFFALSLLGWRIALKKYTSASS